MGFGLGSLNSTLRFDGVSDVDIAMNTISISGSYPFNEKWSLRAGLGLIRDGQLRPEGEVAQEVKPGGLFALGIEYLFQTGGGIKPFMDFSVYSSASSSKTVDPTSDTTSKYFSSDFRLGGRATWNVDNTYFPFVGLRVFAGPVNWAINSNKVVGSDIHHYQVVTGGAFRSGSITSFFEWVPLGEESMSVGLSYSL